MSPIARGRTLPAVAVATLAAFISLAALHGGAMAGEPAVTADSVAVPVGGFPVAVAVNPDTDRLYASHAIDTGMSVVDTATNSTVAEIQLWGAGNGLAVDPTRNRIYAGGDDTVFVIDGATNTLIDTMPVPGANDRLTADPATNLLYAADYPEDALSVIDAGTGSVLTRIGVGSGPQSVGQNPSTGLVYVVNLDSDSVSVIDATSNSVIATTQVADQPNDVAINTNTNRLYITHPFDNSVTVLDGATDDIVASIAVGSPVSVTVDPITNRIYVATPQGSDKAISVIDGATNSVIGTVVLPSLCYPFAGLGDIALNVDTGLLYVPDPYCDVVHVVDTRQPISTPTPAPSPVPPPTPSHHSTATPHPCCLPPTGGPAGSHHGDGLAVFSGIVILGSAAAFLTAVSVNRRRSGGGKVRRRSP